MSHPPPHTHTRSCHWLLATPAAPGKGQEVGGWPGWARFTANFPGHGGGAPLVLAVERWQTRNRDHRSAGVDCSSLRVRSIFWFAFSE